MQQECYKENATPCPVAGVITWDREHYLCNLLVSSIIIMDRGYTLRPSPAHPRRRADPLNRRQGRLLGP